MPLYLKTYANEKIVLQKDMGSMTNPITIK